MNRPLFTGLMIVLLGCTLLAVVDAQAAPNDAKTLQQSLDRPPRWDEKSFAPADGSVVAVNPPAFVWLPLPKRPAKYMLAISTSADFALDATTTIDNVPISVHIPTQTMKPGTWHWRVGARAADGQIVWSKSRRFTIAADVQSWPFPNMEQVVAKIPRAHPRLFFAGKEAERVRTEWPKKSPKDYEQLLRNAQRAIGQPLYPEPGKLTKKGVDRSADYAAIIRSSRPPMDAMETCALAYLASGDRKYGEEAKRLLLHFFAWDPDGATSLFHNDEPAMWVMQRGIRAYDWTYDLFSADERARIEPVMKARALQFLKRLNGMPFESNPYSSHPARDVGFLGEAAIAFIHEWPEAQQWLEYVMKIYWSVYPAWAGEDGGWQEGPSYWGAYMNFALHFVTALKKASGVDITRKPFFHNTPYYALYTNPPYARLSPFGDAAEISATGRASLLYAFARLLNDPYLQWYPETLHSGSGTYAMGLALADPSLKAKPPVDLPQSRVFPGAGLVAMHDDLCDPARSAYLVLRSSPFGSISHGHADQNAFAIEAFGEPLAIASGYYPFYSSPHHDQWTRQTKSVNSITIDGGQGQTSRSHEASGRIESFVAGVNIDYARANATAAYSGRLTKFVRHVVHFRPGTFVIIDELEAPKPVTFEWNLHAVRQMDIRESSGEVFIHLGKARLRASFLSPKGLTFRQTDQFDPPPEPQARNAHNQWHLTAATREKTTKARFFVVLDAYQVKDNTEPQLPKVQLKGESDMYWRNGKRSKKIRLDRDHYRLEAGDVCDHESDRVKEGSRGNKPADILAVDTKRHYEVTLRVDTQEYGCCGVPDINYPEPTTVEIRHEFDPHQGLKMVQRSQVFDQISGSEARRPIRRDNETPPKLSVMVDGQGKELPGRYCRPGPVWEQTFDGEDGRYRVKLPDGLRLISGIQPVRNGEAIALRHGQTLWWYGEVPATTPELKREAEKK